MARAYDLAEIEDRAGNKWANALGTLYTDEAATTLATDAYAAASGGSPVTTIVSDASGQCPVYFDTPKSYWIKWSDNGGTAYPAGNPAQARPFTAFVSKEHQAFEPAGDEALKGTFANRPAAGVAGRFYFAEDQKLFYRDDGTSWQRIVGDPGEIWVTDFGATDDGSTDSTTGIADALAAVGVGRTVVAPIIHGSYYATTDTVHVQSFTHFVARAGSYQVTQTQFARPPQVEIRCSHTTNPAIGLGDPSADNATNITIENIIGVAPRTGIKTTTRNNTNAYQVALKNCGGKPTTTDGNADNAGIVIQNAFWVNIDGGTYHAPTNTTHAIIFRGVSAPSGVVGCYLVNIGNLVLQKGDIFYDQQVNNTQFMGAFDIHHVDLENSAVPILHVRNATTSGAVMEQFKLYRCQRPDSSATPAVWLESVNGSGFASVTLEHVGDITNGGANIRLTGTAAPLYGVQWLGGSVGYVTTGDDVTESPYAEGTAFNGSEIRHVAPATQGTAPGGSDGRTVQSYISRALQFFKSGDRYASMAINAKDIWFGPGGSTGGYDTQMGRGGVGFMYVPMLVKAGAPVDGDFATAPPNGTLAINSSTNKIYCRIGGTWTQVTA